MFLDTVDVERGAATGIITAVFYASTRKGYPIDLKVKYNYLRFQGRGRHSGRAARSSIGLYLCGFFIPETRSGNFDAVYTKMGI